MHDRADAISVSLDDIALRIRAIVGRRTDFPAAESVAVYRGPSGGASHRFSAQLGRATGRVAHLTEMLAEQLARLEGDIAANARDLIAADESVADDVDALTWILGTVGEPPPASPPAATTPPNTTAGSAATQLG